MSACCESCHTPAARTKPGPAAVWRRRLPAMRRLGLSGALIVVGALAAYFGSGAISLASYAASAAISLPSPLYRAWQAARGRILDIHVLMVIAVFGAAVLGDWLEAATVVWLFGVARWLEARSHDRARHAIGRLVELAPTTATVLGAEGESIVAVERVRAGDIVVVRPGERIAVDGAVVAGESSVDQSPVTGESWPVAKMAGDVVFAGSVNGTGALELRATTAASESTLARIARLVDDAQRRRAPVQLFVDRFARRYTPAVVGLAMAIAIVPPLIAGGTAAWAHEFATWSYRALALLVVACPCAFVISTPVSIVSALTSAARHGVLIKGGEHLEQLASVRCVAFDKTGTLTEGRVSVTDVRPVGDASAPGVLGVAASLEARSEHPIGRAIVTRARGEGVRFEPGFAFRALPGLGAEATVSSAAAVVGSHRLFHDRDLCTPALHAHVGDIEARGAVPVLVAHDGSPLGVLGLEDRLRADGRSAVTMLRTEGVERVVLLSGDHLRAVDAAGQAAAIDEVHGELLPEEKVRHVERLRAAHGVVAMVGDGINDAPALAAADVGIAMGVAGTGVALETADVALMTDDLSKLAYALRLARATVANIRLNMIIALGLKAAFVVLAVTGVATLWMAVLADTGASLLVTANSLRLLRVR